MNLALIALLTLISPVLQASSPGITEQWRVREIVLHSSKSYSDPFRNVEVSATFAGPGGKITRPAFWDGGDTWRIRFAPTQIGSWSYTTECSDKSNTGLGAQTGSIECVPYIGNLDVYRHGFLKFSTDKRHLAYRDNTPFFWLGDVHWLWEKERLDESNKPGWNSEFKGMADKRIKQGFTTYQVEIFGRWKGAPLGGSTNPGQNEIDLEQFQKNIDPKWSYLADKGIVVATTLGILPKEVTPTQAENETRMARYVCARYGAYPAVWLMFQECTANFKDQFSNESQRSAYMDAVRSVGQTFQKYDAYNQPRTANSDSSIVTAYRGESWLDFTMFQGGHGKVLDYSRYYNFWFDSNLTIPQLEGESDFEQLYDGSDQNQSQLITVDDVRDKAYRAMQCGCCGYTYGAGGVWQATWDKERTGNQTVYGSTPWRDGIDLPGGDQMSHLKALYTHVSWNSLIPRPECDGVITPNRNLKSKFRPLVSSDLTLKTEVVYLPAGDPFGGALHHLQNAKYSACWFNPREGSFTTIAELNPKIGDWRFPDKPDSKDWLLVLERTDASAPDGPEIASRWKEAKALEALELTNNIAPKARISVSSTDVNNKVYSPQNAVDGNVDTSDWHHWSNDAATDPASVSKPVWLMLEWDRLMPIRKIAFFTMEGYEARDFFFEFDDGSGWKTVPGTVVTGNTDTRKDFVLAKPIVAKRLRFVGKSGPTLQPTIVRVVEIQAISPDKRK